MHYLVTGGCGFIGSHLVRKLVALGHQVTVLDDLSTGFKENLAPGARLIEGNILDEALVSSLLGEAKDGCFHLAAIPSVERCLHEWRATSEVNVLGTISVFEACRKAAPNPVPVVYASSAAAYGANDGMLVEGVTAMKPASSYGVDKLSCELYASIAWANYKLPSVGLRFFNVYGPGQPKDSPYSGVITCFMAAYEQGKPFTIFGDGKQTRDFIYVGDIADSCITAMQSSGKQDAVYNVCTGHATSVLDIASAMADIYAEPLKVDHQPARLGEPKSSCGSPDKLRQAMPELVEFLSLADGLKRTLV